MQVVNLAAAVEIESLLHCLMLEAGRVTPLGCSQRILSNCAQVVADTEIRVILMALLLANGAFWLLPRGETLENKGFDVGSRGRTRTYNHTVNSRVLYH